MISNSNSYIYREKPTNETKSITIIRQQSGTKNPFADIYSQSELIDQQQQQQLQQQQLIKKVSSQKYEVTQTFKTPRMDINAMYADNYSEMYTPNNKIICESLNTNQNDSQYPIKCESPLIITQNTLYTNKNLQQSSLKKFIPTKSIYINNPAEKANEPIQMICPVCCNQIRTVVAYQQTKKTKYYAYALAICLMCWVPYQCDQYFQTAIHYCNQCGKEIARSDPIF